MNINRVGGVDTRLKFNANWTLEGQGVVSSSNLQALNTDFSPSGNPETTCEYNLFPFSSGNAGNGNYYAGPADKLDLKRNGLHFSYEGIYDDISPGFVTVPGICEPRGHSGPLPRDRLPLPPEARLDRGLGAVAEPTLRVRSRRESARHILRSLPGDSRTRTDGNLSASLPGVAGTVAAAGFSFSWVYRRPRIRITTNTAAALRSRLDTFRR